MAIIKKLTIKNYKSFRELIDFELRPLNILIGRNGSGKSNFISFFRLLHRAVAENLIDSISDSGGLNQIRWLGSDRSEFVEWEIIFDSIQNTDDLVYYTGHLASVGNTYSIRLEEVSRDPYPGYSNRYKYLSVSDGYVQILKARPSNEATEAEEIMPDDNSFNLKNEKELALQKLQNPIRYPILTAILESISDWTIFRGFGEGALKNIYDSQDLGLAPFPLRLNTEGKNLVSVLHALENDSLYVSTQEQLDDILKVGFPDFGKLRFVTTASGKAELQWREKNGWQFPARAASDGMLRFLGLATLLLLPDPPSLIAIDEPEIGLHPKLIPLLAELLKDAATRTQVIVTTHSPELLSAEAIEVDDVVVVDREDGATTFKRLASDDLRLWLERYTLGGLWMMGKLEH